MTHQEIIDQIKPELDKVVSFLEKEVQKIRTGRVSPVLVEDVVVDCFGQKFPLKQLSAISCPNSHQIVIQPWDKSYIESIEKAILQSGLGMSAAVDKDVIRLSLPSLTEEHRKNLLRILSEKQEETRRTIRHWREEAWNRIQKEFKEKKIREDDKFRGKDKLQELVDKYHEKIDEIGERKKKEIME